MLAFQIEKLQEYLSTVFKANVKILNIRRLGAEKKGKPLKELKGFGYGVPYHIEFLVANTAKHVVLETMRPEGFGHDHFSDRAQILLWQHSTFNKLPKHVRSVDVGAFTTDNNIKSVGNCKEFFILTEMVEGTPYYQDLEQIKTEKKLRPIDRERCLTLSKYIAEVHAVKRDAPRYYFRRTRELVGHGECIMGLCDSYPPKLEFTNTQELCEIEKRCVEWRWKLKRMTHRLAQVHGDYHPWNILFRENTDFTVLDRSRGEWGEPADDVTAMTINYIFFSLQTFGKLTGAFEELFNLFWKNYLDETSDEEILRVVQPFYAWRGLVVASPVWYPDLPLNVRMKLFNFIKNVLAIEEFKLEDVNSYLT